MHATKDKLKAILATAKEEFGSMVTEFARTHETWTYAEVGKALGISKTEVSQYCRKHGYTRLRGSGSTAAKGVKKYEEG